MLWGGLYVALLAGLVVRVQDPQRPVRPGPAPQPDDPIRLISVHHRIFALLFLAGPLEALVLGGTASYRLAGALMFALGVLLYRAGARTLGDALTPFVEPRAGGGLMTSGLYRVLRHPMYVGQGLIAVGAPLTLGAWRSLGLSVVAVLILVVRVRLEETALRRRFPEYDSYARRAKRIVPYLF
jgi:protein-S-isoprenylcysteine O-methyltransferase Ste14